MRRGIIGFMLATVLLASSGCTGRNPFLARRSVTAPASDAAELSDVRRRNSELQTQNNDLEKRFALTQKELELIRSDLRERVEQLKTLQSEGSLTRKQLDSLRASTRFRGGATITANNSQQQPVRELGLKNAEVVQNRGVVRIRIPASELFEAGSLRLKSGTFQLLDQVTAAVGKNYPGQPVAIEGHTERMAGGSLDAHHLSIAQAKAVFDAVRQSRRTGLQSNPLFIVGMGDNFPLNDRSFSLSRRVEFVIYPK